MFKPFRPSTRRGNPARRRTRQASNSTGGQESQLSVPRKLNSADPFPVAVRKTMTYCEYFTLTSGTAALGTQQAMRLNSVFDPNYTGAGHQPYGYDTMATLYAKYRVDRVNFSLLFTTPGAANDMVCCATVSPGLTAGLTGSGLFVPMERPGGLWGHLSSSGERRCILKGSFDLHTVCGVSKAKYVADDEYAAAIGASPTQVALLAINAGCFDGTASISCIVQVVINMDTYFYNRITLDTS